MKYILALLFIPQIAVAAIKPMDSVFYVYKNMKDIREHHYIFSGYMADYADIKIDPKSIVSEDNTCMKIVYTAEKRQGAGWSGVYATHPANNWGDRKGGYDLSGYTKLKFLIRGEKGTEVIDKIMIGGITGQGFEGDSDSNDTGEMTLTKEWVEHEIDLTKMDLSNIIGGFGFVLNSNYNPNGATFYIDSIRYERQ
jgi:hypothetical protein